MLFESNSADATEKIGRNLDICTGDVVGIFGDLGAGKTAICKGICEKFGINKEDVHSPTFAILNIYNDLVFHFDAYRLTPESFISGGFDEFLEEKNVCLIEWAENIPESYLTKKNKLICSGDEARKIIFEKLSS
jgi:tRNA threonylcarbamoyladenosine biosynthesis protein TsaE